MTNLYYRMLLQVYQVIVAVMVCCYRFKMRLNPDHRYAALYAERLGRNYPQRPASTLVWLHVASLGEYNGVKPLLLHILQARPDIHLLLTSSSRNSAAFLKANLPDRCQHIMLPFDSRPLMRRFIQYWQPQAVIWTESELWPNTIGCIRQCTLPLTLVNARLSGRAAQQWSWFKPLVTRLLHCFERVFAVDQATFDALLALGYPQDRLQLTGSLKLFAAPLSADIGELTRLRQQVAGRLVWVAASTHAGEEAIMLMAHQQLQLRYAHILLIICPRRPQRGEAVTQLVKRAGFRVAQRSQQQPLQPQTAVYIADTLGELGLWYRLVDIAFLGGSLVPVGGHNPYEAIRLNTRVMHGPQVANFTDTYAQLKANGEVHEVRSATDICTLLEQWHRAGPASQQCSTQVRTATPSTLDDIMAAVLAGIALPGHPPIAEAHNQ